MTGVFSRTAVCNTGPLIGLARAGLEWLPFRLFPEVIVPGEVVDELLDRESPDGSQIHSALSAARILSESPRPDALLLAELDRGEAAVIATALAQQHAVVILDERKARRIAHGIYGLQVKGTAGLLIQGKLRGLIPEVGPVLQKMCDGGYHLSRDLVAATLKEAGETDFVLQLPRVTAKPQGPETSF